MHRASMGTGTRTVLFFLAISSIVAATWLWQVMFTNPAVGIVDAIGVIIIPATIGVLAGYYSIRG